MSSRVHNVSKNHNILKNQGISGGSFKILKGPGGGQVPSTKYQASPAVHAMSLSNVPLPRPYAKRHGTSPCRPGGGKGKAVIQAELESYIFVGPSGDKIMGGFFLAPAGTLWPPTGCNFVPSITLRVSQRFFGSLKAQR